MNPKIDQLTHEANEALGRLRTERARLDEVAQIKSQRQFLDSILQTIKNNPHQPVSPGLTNAAHYTTNAIMWLGIALKELNEANPYPESKNPASPVIEPTADALKL